MNIIILDGYALNPGDLSYDRLQQFGTLTIYDRTAPEQVIERAKEADALLTNKVVLGEREFAQLPRLRYIGGTLINAYGMTLCGNHGLWHKDKLASRTV